MDALAQRAGGDVSGSAESGLMPIDRRAACAVGVAALAGFAAAAPAATTAAAARAVRSSVTLDDGWRFHLGHASEVDRDFGYGRDQRTFAKAGVTSPATLAGFDDADWARVRVPHDWATELPYASPSRPLPAEALDANAAHGFKAIGRDFPENSVGWYRLPLPIGPDDADRRISLMFDGVFRDATVFVNGYAVASNESGYAPFTIDITDFLDVSAPNMLALRVDASFGEGWFYEGAGIYRHVRLVRTGALHIPEWGVFIQSEVDSAGAALAILTELAMSGPAMATVVVRHRIRTSAGTVVAEGSSAAMEIAGWSTGTGLLQLRIPSPRLWSLADPHLYTCETVLAVDGTVVDRVETRFGVRTIRFDAEHGFFLNGRPVKLLGACNHQDHAGVGIAIPDRLNQWRVEQLREMGANAWRSAHSPASTSLLDACDQLGMLMIDEARINSTSSDGIDELARMVRRDRNHPCIILWSVGNEEPHQGTPRGARISAEMGRHIRQLDPTRPITQAFDGAFGLGASQVVDVVGFNYRTDQMAGFHQRFPELPLIGTEVGSTTTTRGVYFADLEHHKARAYDLEHPSWSSTAQEWWKIVDAAPYIAGGFIWTGFDYRGEPTPFNTYPSVASNMGVMDLCGFPKDNFYYYRANWRREEPQVHLLPHWSWLGREGQTIDVWAYSNCDEVELLVNGRSVGRQPMQRNGHLSWQVPFVPGSIEAIGYRSGKRACTMRHETVGAPRRLAMSADRIRIAADGNDVALVTVQVLDARNRPLPDAADEVSVRLNGPIRLLGTGNGDPTDTTLDRSPRRRLFHGLMQAIVQSDGRSGRGTIIAEADGFAPVSLALNALPA